MQSYLLSYVVLKYIGLPKLVKLRSSEIQCNYYINSYTFCSYIRYLQRNAYHSFLCLQLENIYICRTKIVECEIHSKQTNRVSKNLLCSCIRWHLLSFQFSLEFLRKSIFNLDVKITLYFLSLNLVKIEFRLRSWL